MRLGKVALLAALASLAAGLHPAWAARISDVQNTKHNLSVTPFDTGVTDTRTVKAVSETQICVFCHTPHGAETAVGAPLWNRKFSSATYTGYFSTSIEAYGGGDIPQPTTSSKLCLSCHDGTLAIGAVNVLGGQVNQTIGMTGAGTGGVMPDGSGATTGYTRNLGTNLSNDHPISFTYNTTLASADGELRDPAISAHIVNRVQGAGVGSPPVPLVENKVECVGCHDPHIRDTVDANIKFLRLNRFQTNVGPSDTSFSQANDQVCLACHKKDGWVDSAHANQTVAAEIYSAAAATQREFPANLPVWRAACLNCHDTHTVQGARMLLREGTDSVASPKQGGNSAQEETCYQCHATGTTLTSQGLNTEVPDIKAEFALARRMPITNLEQGVGVAGPERHRIGGAGAGTGKDMQELPLLLGKLNVTNRHIECTDCHNPHRVIKNRLLTGNPAIADAAGTHDHNAPTGHTNIASGVLRGSWGVEPQYASAAFAQLPTGYLVKKGVPPVSGPTNVEQTYVTREYQVCLKCHSDYGYDDNNAFPTGNRPPLGYTGGTPLNTNGLTQYTNQAMEFQAPAAHMASPASTVDSGAAAAYGTNNHRSWHPVVAETGRTTAVRGGANANLFVAPFNIAVGTQTMYCSDCHGSNTQPGTAVPDGNIAGENGRAWGPHGSENNFLLKGPWNTSTGTGQPEGLCFKCHNYDDYANPASATPKKSGFSGTAGMMCGVSPDTNFHVGHAARIGRLRCNWCHTAVPHGWKNKALLVNLNDVGPEAGLAAGTARAAPYNQGPYYMNSMLTVTTFAASGSWTSNDCSGRNWMMSTCFNPP